MVGIPMIQTAVLSYRSGEGFEVVKSFVTDGITLAYKAREKCDRFKTLKDKHQKIVDRYISNVMIGTEMSIERTDNGNWRVGDSPYSGN